MFVDEPHLVGARRFLANQVSVQTARARNNLRALRTRPSSMSKTQVHDSYKEMLVVWNLMLTADGHRLPSESAIDPALRDQVNQSLREYLEWKDTK